MNKIVVENLQPGVPASEWDIIGADDGSIEGFATEISVNLGEIIHFKINTAATAYRLDIYRMGYYGGKGARKIVTVQPLVNLPQFQPPGVWDPATGLLDCGNWGVSASWTVPVDATSGIYFAKLVREDGNIGASHIFFIVRDDNNNSDLLFQSSDSTWQAYNDYGGNSLYAGGPGASPIRAYKVSYNRPFITRLAEGGANWVFNAEYPMVRWLEANGYDITYCSGVDTDRFGEKILKQKVFLSVGHDEYWSAQQRANVEAARDAGVHLAFFSGNEVFWKTRWENSIDGSNTPYRTLVCYKDTHANAKIDPSPVWTGTWRDPRFSPPFDGGRPENALTGTIFGVQGFTDNAISVSAEDGKLRFWRDTTIANLAPGQEVSLTTGTLGYEWDEDVDNGFRPAGLIRLSSTVINTNYLLQDNGSTYGPGTATHQLTLYRHSSGALVFGAGTAQWSWGLDNNHDTHGNDPGTPDLRMQQAMVNLFADMGVQPESLQPGLIPASASTDTTPPTSTINFPTDGEILQPGQPITILGAIMGAASDVGGVVCAVEVSVDGGLTWHPAVGRENWSYSWTANGNGLVTILSRAVDDSGNLQDPSTSVDVIVGEAVDEGPGGPILVIVNGSYSAKNPFGNYLSEILRAEGLIAFKKVELTMLMREGDPLSFLNTFKLVLLAETGLLPDQQQLIRAYVSGGGNLIAMRPDPALADLFGLSFVSQRPEIPGEPQFFALDTTSGPGGGLTSVSLQYHGDADNYSLAGAFALADLWDDINTPSLNPAVTLNKYGNGKAAAFAFDFAKNIVLMRQGNPDWKNSEGDGVSDIRATDMFARTDGRIWYEPQRLRIPQADEQQRFLANLILDLTGEPMPRLWYLPARHKLLIINTGDSCSSDKSKMDRTVKKANKFGPISIYLYSEHIKNEIDHNTDQSWRTNGNEVGVHAFDPTQQQTFPTLHTTYSQITAKLQTGFHHGSRSARNHTVDWVGWVDMAKIEAEFGTQLDLNYYHYFQFLANSSFPKLRTPAEKGNATGYFTGSGLAQRFCDENGAILPIYQLLTEWADEFFDDNKFTKVPYKGFTVLDVINAVKEMIAAAETGYYSAFVMQTHPARFFWWTGPEQEPPGVLNPWTNDITYDWATKIWAYASEQGIPMLSAEKFLDFVEARNNAGFDNMTWDGSLLTFDFQVPNAGQELTLMLPADNLVSIEVDGGPVSFTVEILMGRSYALFTTTAVNAHVCCQLRANIVHNCADSLYDLERPGQG